jgi:hypothetical protein
MCRRAVTFLCHAVLYTRYSTVSSASILTSHRTQSINNGNAGLMSLSAMVTGMWLTQSLIQGHCIRWMSSSTCTYFEWHKNVVWINRFYFFLFFLLISLHCSVCSWYDRHVVYITEWNIHKRLLLHEIHPQSFSQNTFVSPAVVPIKVA